MNKLYVCVVVLAVSAAGHISRLQITDHCDTVADFTVALTLTCDLSDQLFRH